MKLSRFALLFGALFLAALPVSIPLVASAQAGQRREGVLIVGGSNQREGYKGRGRYVLVSGRGNNVDISGTTTTVRVTGHNNQIHVNSVRQIEVAGTNNRVTYFKTPGGGTPRIYQRAGNQVKQGK